MGSPNINTTYIEQSSRRLKRLKADFHRNFGLALRPVYPEVASSNLTIRRCNSQQCGNSPRVGKSLRRIRHPVRGMRLGLVGNRGG